ncbi:MAG: HAMP domain-containing histidine kinase [Bryobacteraceae bacterium]|nr:HAMP domain-containing histidine kinase [Bryobacteraceae bacterium]
MNLQALRKCLLPNDAEQDEGFRQEILRLSHQSLKIIAAVQAGAAVAITLAHFAVGRGQGMVGVRLLQSGIMIALGGFLLAMHHLPAAYARSRTIAVLTAFASGSVATWFSLWIAPRAPYMDNFIPSQVTLVVLVAIAAIPLKPKHTLALCLSLAGFYAWAASRPESFSLPPATMLDPTYLFFFLILSVLAVSLTAVAYEQRHRNYQAYQETLTACDNLRVAQQRMLSSEHSATLGRIAAGLSHEFNSPLGALTSAIDTLLLLSSKQVSATPVEQQRYVSLQAELRKTISESSERIRKTILRMQRFTNLDQAEIRRIDINHLLEDVAALVRPGMDSRHQIVLDLKPVPRVICRPQQLSAAFATLLNNAMEAVDGNGRITIGTLPRGAEIEVRIGDNGRGVMPEDMAAIFEPGFRETAGRISSANWGMFSARQIVREHGGEISIVSTPREGTTVSVVLPGEASPRSIRIS